MDDRSLFWLRLFNLASRTRVYEQGQPLPLNPINIIELIDKLELACSYEEAIEVIAQLDAEEINKKK